MNFERSRRLLSFLRRAVDDYEMIKDGDKIAVGISGGKDSMALVCILNELRRFYPEKFEIVAITVDTGFKGMDFTPLMDFFAEMGIEYVVEKTNIAEVVFNIRKESNPCSLCAKLRRGSLNTALTERGISKIALGHHYDDAVETLMMNLLFEGRIGCFQPVTFLDRTGVTQIRPLLYCHEDEIQRIANREKLPIVHNTCPIDGHSRRQEVKELLASMEKTYPDLKQKIFGAMQRYPLYGWRDGGAER